MYKVTRANLEYLNELFENTCYRILGLVLLSVTVQGGVEYGKAGTIILGQA